MQSSGSMTESENPGAREAPGAKNRAISWSSTAETASSLMSTLYSLRNSTMSQVAAMILPTSRRKKECIKKLKIEDRGHPDGI